MPQNYHETKNPTLNFPWDLESYLTLSSLVRIPQTKRHFKEGTWEITPSTVQSRKVYQRVVYLRTPCRCLKVFHNWAEKGREINARGALKK